MGVVWISSLWDRHYPDVTEFKNAQIWWAYERVHHKLDLVLNLKGYWLRSSHMSAHKPISVEGCTIFVKTGHLLVNWERCLNRHVSDHRVELPPSSVRAPLRESNKRGFKVQCPVMESNFELFRFESRLCRRSFGVKIQGSKPEKLGFHPASCNMQLLANYTKYYTVAIFKRKSLIYIRFWRAWISVNP